jgi:hypothetical protein
MKHLISLVNNRFLRVEKRKPSTTPHKYTKEMKKELKEKDRYFLRSLRKEKFKLKLQ